MNSKQPVTVIGLGPMGQAMVQAFLDKGHQVTVWNRTASRADALVERGAVLAGSIEEALAANELVVLSLIDYNATYAVLEQAPHALSGRVLVNLSSDTPDTPSGSTPVNTAATWTGLPWAWPASSTSCTPTPTLASTPPFPRPSSSCSGAG